MLINDKFAELGFLNANWLKVNANMGCIVVFLNANLSLTAKSSLKKFPLQ